MLLVWEILQKMFYLFYYVLSVINLHIHAKLQISGNKRIYAKLRADKRADTVKL